MRKGSEEATMSVDNVVREWWGLEVGAAQGVFPRDYSNRGYCDPSEYQQFGLWCQARVNAALSRTGIYEPVAREFLMAYSDGGGVRMSKWVRILRDAILTEMEKNPWRVVL